MKPLLAGFLIIFSSTSFGHGMDKPGPHGGFIQMPGAFHTELVPEGENAFKLYLLDVEFKNPVVKKSSVSGHLQRGENRSALACQAKHDHFFCELPGGLKWKNGDTVLLNTDRTGVTGGLSVFKFPLKLTSPVG